MCTVIKQSVYRLKLFEVVPLQKYSTVNTIVHNYMVIVKANSIFTEAKLSDLNNPLYIFFDCVCICEPSNENCLLRYS